jgi:hypothetical protein
VAGARQTSAREKRDVQKNLTKLLPMNLTSLSTELIIASIAVIVFVLTIVLLWRSK